MKNNIIKIGKRCSGCRGCEQACPVNCIKFQYDSEGFMQPYVDDKICIECGKCLRVCPINNINVFYHEQKGYGAKTNEKNDIKKCSSGGIFYVLAKEFIAKKGVVCGCSISKDMMPVHRCVTTLDEVQGMRGSKYVQSNMEGVFMEVKQHLIAGKYVLFTGVPCQVAGLRNFLVKEYPNLFCVDIICHGVPSRKLYKEYLEWLGLKYGGKVINYEFRSKRKHQWSLTLHADIEQSNGKLISIEKMASLDPFYYNFLSGSSYRESCYTCPYSQSNRPGDITLGDFWGVEKTNPELVDINGVSCVLINSEKGYEIWSRINSNITCKEVNIENIINNNGNLRAATSRPFNRDIIYRHLNDKGFDSIPYDISKKNFIIDSIKDYIPNYIRYKIKTITKLLRS